MSGKSERGGNRKSGKTAGGLGGSHQDAQDVNKHGGLEEPGNEDNTPATSSNTKDDVSEYNCGTCNNVVKDDEKAIECGTCKIWFHTTCEGMDDVVYNYIVSVEEQISWYCIHCKKGSVKIYKRVEEIGEQINIVCNKQTEIEKKVKVLAEVVEESQEASRTTEVRLGAVEVKSVTMEDKMENLTEKQSNMETRLSNLEARFVALEEKQSLGAESNINYTEVVKKEAVPALKDIITEEMEQFKKGMEENNKKQKEEQKRELQNLKDEEARRNNIIFYGVPESKEKAGDKRRDDDLKFVVEITEKMEIELNRNSVTKVIRLGKLEDNARKPRPLLVGFDSLAMKQDILTQTKKLRDMEEYKDVYWNHDLTKAQREKVKTLVTQAKELEAKDTSGNFLYRVRGPPEKLVIRKIKKQV